MKQAEWNETQVSRMPVDMHGHAYVRNRVGPRYSARSAELAVMSAATVTLYVVFAVKSWTTFPSGPSNQIQRNAHAKARGIKCTRPRFFVERCGCVIKLDVGQVAEFDMAYLWSKNCLRLCRG